MTYVAVVTIHTDTKGDARLSLEEIENESFGSFAEVVSRLNGLNIETENIEVSSIRGFMDSYNNEELNVSNTFMGYVQIKN